MGRPMQDCLTTRKCSGSQVASAACHSSLASAGGSVGKGDIHPLSSQEGHRAGEWSTRFCAGCLAMQPFTEVGNWQQKPPPFHTSTLEFPPALPRKPPLPVSGRLTARQGEVLPLGCVSVAGIAMVPHLCWR